MGMQRNYDNLILSVKHLKTLNQVFLDSSNFSDRIDWQIHKDNYRKLSRIISSPDIELFNQLYNTNDRQMILADMIEYIFFARGYYAITSGGHEAKKQKKKQFIRMILHFVNILMGYESMTVDEKLRKAFLKKLKEKVPAVKKEELFDTLATFKGTVGLPLEGSEQEEVKELNRYFDKMLPKTAGGLWHELLVFVFLIRHNLGFIVPLVLNQRLLSGTGSLVPPDFLIIAKDKHVYGIEVGTKKEIQSGLFSLSTNIPTATIDTENSRSSDRCPICKRWIPFCDKVIDDFSDLDKQIPLSPKISCLEECKIHSKAEISKGKCPYTKYSRTEARSLKYTQIEYANGLHYHYRCVLNALPSRKRALLIKAEDTTALKTHYPYYSGLESLLVTP
jgi:hypothetical protein